MQRLLPKCFGHKKPFAINVCPVPHFENGETLVKFSSSQLQHITTAAAGPRTGIVEMVVGLGVAFISLRWVVVGLKCCWTFTTVSLAHRGKCPNGRDRIGSLDWGKDPSCPRPYLESMSPNSVCRKSSLFLRWVLATPNVLYYGWTSCMICTWPSTRIKDHLTLQSFNLPPPDVKNKEPGNEDPNIFSSGGPC